MDRREALQTVLAGTLPVVVSSLEGEKEGKGQKSRRIRGVAVLYYPPGQENRRVAASIAPLIKEGSVLLLPNTVNEQGNYEWELRIEGGELAQVEVKRPE